MSEEPAWLLAQRAERQKSMNLAIGCGFGAAITPVMLWPASLIARGATGLSMAALGYAAATIGLVFAAKRFTMKGSVPRYAVRMLSVVSGFTTLVLGAITAVA